MVSSLTIISCIRLRSLITFAKTENPTRKRCSLSSIAQSGLTYLTEDFYDIALWSALELTTGVIVACLPALRQTLVRYGPNLRTIVSQYASRASGPEWSNSKSNNHNNSQGNDNTSRQRRQHRRLSDEIPMSNFSHRISDHDHGHESRDDLSRTDSESPSYQAPSPADIKGQATVYIKPEVGRRAGTPDVEASMGQKPMPPVPTSPATSVDRLPLTAS